MADIDKKHLAGLKFRSSKPSKESSGNVPTERALAPGDVMDWKDNGATVTITTFDGRKHVVDKNPKAKPAGGSESAENDQ